MSKTSFTAALSIAVSLVLFQPAHGADEKTPDIAAGDFPSDLKQAMEKSGCTMREPEMFDLLTARGATLSDIQATIMQLVHSGELKWDGKESYRLNSCVPSR